MDVTGTTDFVAQLWKNLTNSDCQKKCNNNDVPEEISISEESLESTEERHNQTLDVECIPRASAPKVFTAKSKYNKILLESFITM